MKESASLLRLAGTGLFFWDYSEAAQLCSSRDLRIRSVPALALDLTAQRLWLPQTG